MGMLCFIRLFIQCRAIHRSGHSPTTNREVSLWTWSMIFARIPLYVKSGATILVRYSFSRSVGSMPTRISSL